MEGVGRTSEDQLPLSVISDTTIPEIQSFSEANDPNGSNSDSDEDEEEGSPRLSEAKTISQIAQIPDPSPEELARLEKLRLKNRINSKAARDRRRMRLQEYQKKIKKLSEEREFLMFILRRHNIPFQLPPDEDACSSFISGDAPMYPSKKRSHVDVGTSSMTSSLPHGRMEYFRDPTYVDPQRMQHLDQELSMVSPDVLERSRIPPQAVYPDVGVMMAGYPNASATVPQGAAFFPPYVHVDGLSRGRSSTMPDQMQFDLGRTVPYGQAAVRWTNAPTTEATSRVNQFNPFPLAVPYYRPGGVEMSMQYGYPANYVQFSAPAEMERVGGISDPLMSQQSESNLSRAISSLPPNGASNSNDSGFQQGNASYTKP